MCGFVRKRARLRLPRLRLWFYLPQGYRLDSYWLRYRGVRFPLRLGETILGRSPYCSVVIPDNEVSRTHAVVRLTREGPEIQDLNSANGTRVNNLRIDEPHLLCEGDRIGIGSAELEVVSAEPDAYQETQQRPLESTITSDKHPIDPGAEPATEQPEAQRRATLAPTEPVEKD